MKNLQKNSITFKLPKMTDKINLMLDIETVSTKSNACIVSIAGVFWRNFTPQPLSTCYINLEVDEQLHKLNRVADWSTIKWWTNQPNAQAFETNIKSYTNVYQPILTDPQPHWHDEVRVNPIEALCQLQIWIEQNCINLGIAENDLLIWSKSPSFDLVILTSFLEQEKLGKLGTFWNWRDVRTYVNFDDATKQQMRSQIDNSMYEPHLPIDDCMIQINEVCETNKIYQGLLKLALDD